MVTEEDMNALHRYILWDDAEFELLTEGPRHRQLLLSILDDKKSNVLLREALIARQLGLKHNTQMHSTVNGESIFDATCLVFGNHYEIKAEQHTSENLDRKFQSGQLSGTGVFSTIVDDASFNRLRDNDPIIAHGMFIDRRLVLFVTFRLSECQAALDRIERYFRGSTKTAPRYSYQDWYNIPSLKIEYVSPHWPANISRKYRKEFMQRAGLLPIQPQTSSQKKRSAPSTKSHPNLQIPIPCTLTHGQQLILNFEDTLPICLSEIS